MRLLDDRWALVTGSTRGIGQQIALGLAQRKCNVIVHGRAVANTRETMELLEQYRVGSRAVAGELESPEEAQSIIEQVRAGPGVVDILYNNAAIQNEWRSIWDISRQEWLRTFQINLFAIVALCSAFAPEMKRRGFGRIVNLTSGIKDVPELAPYSVSKAAVDKYTSDLAAELRDTNVLVNRLDPGWLRTDLGGPDGEQDVETVLPGALVPALLEDHGPSGRLYAAQDYTYLER